MEEEQAEQTETERQQREVEQKKRWESLRGSGTTTKSTNNDDLYNKDDEKSNSPKPVGVNDAINSPSIFRGRGRGVANVNLRRPGEMPSTQAAAVPTTTTYNNSSNNIMPPPGFERVAPPPGLGRGTKMFMGNFHDYESQLFAGARPAPHPSEAPTPPAEWVK